MGEPQVVGLPGVIVDFTNSTTGTMVSCQWNFGDGTTLNSCGSQVSHTYASSTRRTYVVTLTVNASTLTRAAYVLVGCQVPSFSGVRQNNAVATWTAAGFAQGNISIASGNGNYFINNQSLAGGLLNPAGGCGGAVISVGP